MVRRHALPAPAPLPRATAGEAGGTGPCTGLAHVASASPNPWGWVTETLGLTMKWEKALSLPSRCSSAIPDPSGPAPELLRLLLSLK